MTWRAPITSVIICSRGSSSTRLVQAGSARIVNVASIAHYKAKGIDWGAVRKSTRTVTGLREYEVSKLSNVLFTKALAKRLDGTGVTTYAVHPGVVATDVWRQVPAPVRWVIKRFMITPEEGAARASSAPRRRSSPARPGATTTPTARRKRRARSPRTSSWPTRSGSRAPSGPAYRLTGQRAAPGARVDQV